MIEKPSTFRELIALWKPFRLLAQDTGIKHATVYQWRSRGNIHSSNWNAIIRAARARHGIVLDANDMCAMAARASDKADTARNAA